MRKESVEVELLIFQKNTHTDQYPHRPIPIQTNTHTDQYPYRPIPTQTNTHTDQYLNFSSYHPLHQKMGVIHPLLDRCETLATEEEDKRKEREHIEEALTRCGYPQWTVSTVQRKMKTKKEDNIMKKTVEKDKSRGIVVLPYVQGLSETTSWIMKKYKQ